MRVFSEQVYGIPPEQVVCSSGKLDFELRDGTPVLVKLPDLVVHNDFTFSAADKQHCIAEGTMGGESSYGPRTVPALPSGRFDVP
jgi:hypothetical protein